MTSENITDCKGSSLPSLRSLCEWLMDEAMCLQDEWFESLSVLWCWVVGWQEVADP